MKKGDSIYCTYLDILKEELVPAMGCTEPIALAYAAAKGREVLGILPNRIMIQVSGSIIKNVKSVIVPNTNQMKGIKAAVAAGIIAGCADKELEVLSSVSDNERESMLDYLDKCQMDIQSIEDGHVFDIIITEYDNDSYSRIRITDFHTNIVLIEKNGECILKKELDDNNREQDMTDRSLLTMEGIWEFASVVDIQDVKDILDRQIKYNSEIAEEGLKGKYGANIGTLLGEVYKDDVKIRARAKAAAGSDARMNGCEFPVIINSGSGNQGITCSVPVIEYARELHSDLNSLYRALIISNLVAIHEKSGIGTLSAFCGAVSAGAGAGAGIAYLCGGDFNVVSHTVVNALAIVSGIVCDGAKASCAAKIASSVDAGILGYYMAIRGNDFQCGDGIVRKDIESTIRGIGRIGKEGMKQTNEEIINLMLNEKE